LRIKEQETCLTLQEHDDDDDDDSNFDEYYHLLKYDALLVVGKLSFDSVPSQSSVHCSPCLLFSASLFSYHRYIEREEIRAQTSMV
jgi:hypothetical protein